MTLGDLVQMTRARLVGLWLGPVLFVLLLSLPLPDGMTPAGRSVAATAVLMACWWITEAIPIPATALLPIVLFPLLGVTKAAEVTTAYGNHLIFLFMGGFLIAVTIEKWNLHKRIALNTVCLVGVTPERIVLGFMVATAFISMWISNTAAALMMTTIGLAVIRQTVTLLEQSSRPVLPGELPFATALMLGIAYAASIGGVATLVGTPPNAILAGMLEKNMGISIGFAQWMAFALPLSAIMLVLTWYYLTHIAFRSRLRELPGGKQAIYHELIKIGLMSREEKMVLAVFALVAIAWILRGLLDTGEAGMIADSTIAMVGALLLFVIPVDLRRGRFLLDWQTAVKIPWDIILLFGGGFALANGFSSSGLTQWLGQQLTGLHGVSPLLIIFAVVLLVIFLTEVTSNTATATLMLPMVGALALAADVHPLGPMVAVTIAASYAFMLPVATPPNAIVFASRQVTVAQMARTGLWLNIIGTLLITALVTWLMPLMWGIDLSAPAPAAR